MPELENAYRRLLLAYPRYFRRERGLEMLTTLMDAAEPDRTRPSRSDVVHLIVTGLRYRLAPPTPLARAVAIVVTAWIALVCSGAGALAAWTIADPPRPQLTGALSDDLIGRPPLFTYVSEPSDWPLILAYDYKAGADLHNLGAEAWTGPRPAPIGDVRVYDGVPNDRSFLTPAQQALQNAGWQTGAQTDDGTFWALRDRVLLRFSGAPDGQVTVNIFPVEPDGILAGAITGPVVGVLLAWPAMTWLTHRIDRSRPPVRRLMWLLSVPAVAACLINTMDTVLSMVPDWENASVLLAVDWMYPLANQVVNPLAPIVVSVSLTAIAVLLAQTGRTPRLRVSQAG